MFVTLTVGKGKSILLACVCGEAIRPSNRTSSISRLQAKNDLSPVGNRLLQQAFGLVRSEALVALQLMRHSAAGEPGFHEARFLHEVERFVVLSWRIGAELRLTSLEGAAEESRLLSVGRPMRR